MGQKIIIENLGNKILSIGGKLLVTSRIHSHLHLSCPLLAITIILMFLTMEHLFNNIYFWLLKFFFVGELTIWHGIVTSMTRPLLGPNVVAIVATLGLGSQPKQKSYKVMAQEEARE